MNNDKEKPYYICCGEEVISGHRYDCVYKDKEKGYKNRFVGRVASSCPIEMTEVLNFNTKEELLENETVKGFREPPGFYRYSVSRCSTKWHMMAEYKGSNGEIDSWVIGSLRSNEGLDFPEWKE